MLKINPNVTNILIKKKLNYFQEVPPLIIMENDGNTNRGKKEKKHSKGDEDVKMNILLLKDEFYAVLKIFFVLSKDDKKRTKSFKSQISTV